MGRASGCGSRPSGGGGGRRCSASPLLVALAGGAATALAAGARRADTAYTRFREATGEPNLTAHIDLSGIETAGAHVEAIDELAAIDGVESVEVESWWAIELHQEDPDVVVPFATGTFATAGEVGEPIVLDGALPDSDDPNGVTINKEAHGVLRRRSRRHADVRHGVTGAPRRVGSQRRPVRIPRCARRTDDRGRGGRRRPVRG